MATRMTGLCLKGAALIWKQCNKDLYRQGVAWLEDAAYSGDADAWYFLGTCKMQGIGGEEINEKQAEKCFRKAASLGSFRVVLGAMQAGFPAEEYARMSGCSPEESIRELRSAAEQGDAYAAYQLGKAYEDGLIFHKQGDGEPSPQPSALGISWYKKAADGGIVDAMVILAKSYQSGRYTEENQEKCLDWAEKAAAAGHVWGLFQMGEYYRVCEEMEAAFAYYQAASRQGEGQASLYLGRMYLNGEGTGVNLLRSLEAFQLAAEQGIPESYLELGLLYSDSKRMAGEEEKAVYWLKLAYEAELKKAALPLAKLYLKEGKLYQEEGKLLEKAESLFGEAESLLKEAAELKDAELEECGEAAFLLGDFYREGQNGVPSLETAIGWYEKGAEQGNTDCMEMLGEIFFQGEDGVDADYAKAYSWLSRCRESGRLKSCFRLGFLYARGCGCEKEEEEAIELFLKAAETEIDGAALYELGYLYEQREQTQDNLEQAASYYQQAIERGNEAAKLRFSHFKRNLFGRWKRIGE